jgi:G:T-mismatch repair DNA endonuclease (very short patch repair protein)/DNA-directed RNA polymerase subunit RPC12/RpoP
MKNDDMSVEYICDECGKACKTPGGLLNHQKTHSSSEPHHCPHCDRTFIHLGKLVEHIPIHYVETCGVAREELEKQYEMFRSRLAREQVNPPLPEEAPPQSPNPPTLPPQVGGAIPDEEVDELYREHRHAIESYYRKRKILDIFNMRVDNNIQEALDPVLDVYSRHITTKIKINASLGFILRHKVTGEFRYFHSSVNNHAVFDRPHTVGSEVELRTFLNELFNIDFLEWIRQRRPNTAWVTHKVTNITFFFYKLIGAGKIGKGDSKLPDYITSKRCIVTLEKNLRTGEKYKDNLCFFRALSIVDLCVCQKTCKCRRPHEVHTKQLYHKWCCHTGQPQKAHSFPGVTLLDLLQLERLFNVSVSVFQTSADGVGSIAWKSKSCQKKKMNLNLHNNHFSLIKNINTFARSYVCEECKETFGKLPHLKRHKCKQLETRLRFPSGNYRPKPSVFEALHDRAGVFVPHPDRLFPYRITYDIESYMSNEDLPEASKKLIYTACHRLMSVSVCSNVPGFTSPMCFVSEGDEYELVKKFVDYITTIQRCSEDLLLNKFQPFLRKLDEAIVCQQEAEASFLDAPFSHKATYHSRSLSVMKKTLLSYLAVIPVVGFNSGSYDLNVIKPPLLRIFHETGKIHFSIKRNSRLQCLQTDKFKFLDMINYLTPGTSYKNYLKAFDVSTSKGYFPYDYITSLEILQETSLPPREAFYNKLKGKELSEKKYAICQNVWRTKNMKTMKDFLVWYNNLDVEPFLEAIAKQTTIYASKNIDMFKHAISIPGIAVLWKFHVLKDTPVDIPLISTVNRDLYHTVKANIVGGPSIVFHRYHEKGVTELRGHDYKADAKKCQNVVGFDANALYLWSMMQDMPTGSPIRRRGENNFRPEFTEKYGRMAWTWLEHISQTNNIKIEHKYNGGEYRVGQHNLPVDGFYREEKTIFQFHGCLFHGHTCHITSNIDHNPINGKTFEELSEDTKEKERYIIALGFKLVVKRECEWLRDQAIDKGIRDFVKCLEFRAMSKNIPMTEKQIIKALQNDEFFGLIECDISVPPHLHDKFSEMSPIFKNVTISRENLGQHMRQFVEDTKSFLQPQRMLVGSLQGTKILLLSTLAKWYLEHGLEITKVYQIVQYRPSRCFERFGHSVTEARRSGDVDSSKTLLANISKLVGKSIKDSIKAPSTIHSLVFGLSH